MTDVARNTGIHIDNKETDTNRGRLIDIETDGEKYRDIWIERHRDRKNRHK